MKRERYSHTEREREMMDQLDLQPYRAAGAYMGEREEREFGMSTSNNWVSITSGNGDQHPKIHVNPVNTIKLLHHATQNKSQKRSYLSGKIYDIHFHFQRKIITIIVLLHWPNGFQMH